MIIIQKKLLYLSLIATILAGCGAPTPRPTPFLTATFQASQTLPAETPIPATPTPASPNPMVTATPDNPTLENALLGEIKAMDNHFQRQVFSSPRWVHFPAHYTYAVSPRTYPLGTPVNSTAFNRDDYVLLDDTGMVAEMVSAYMTFLTTTYRNGVYRDYPGGQATQKDSFPPPIFSTDFGFYDLAVLGVKNGDLLQKDPPNPSSLLATYRLTVKNSLTEAVFDTRSGRVASLTIYGLSGNQKALVEKIEPQPVAGFASGLTTYYQSLLWQPATPSKKDLTLTLTASSRDEVSGWLAPSPSAGDIAPQSLGAAAGAKLTGENGKEILLTPAREIPTTPGNHQAGNSGRLQFTLKPTQNQPLPATFSLTIQSAVVETHPQTPFTFDQGAHPQVGQTWALNQALDVAGYTIKLVSAQWIAMGDSAGPQFTFAKSEGVEAIGLADSVHQNFTADHASSADQMTAGIYYNGEDLSGGPLKLTIDRLDLRVQGPWTASQAAPPQGVITPAPSQSLPPSGNSLFSLQSRAGGSASGVALLGTTAYIGIGPTLAAIDVSQPSDPSLLAQSATLPGKVSGVVLISASPTPRLAVSAGRYLVVLAAAPAGGLEIAGQVALPGEVKAMVLDSQSARLYAGGSENPPADPNSGSESKSFISAIDVSASSSPRLINQVDLSGEVWSLAMGNQRLYAGLAQNGQNMGIVGIPLDPPGQLGQPALAVPASDTFHPARSMQVLGSRLYVGSNEVMIAYDMANPAAPAEKWRISQTGSNNPNPIPASVEGFVLHQDRIDAIGPVCYEACLFPLGPSIIVPPEPITGTTDEVTASMVAGNQDRLYLANDGLEIYGYSQAGSLVKLGVYTPDLAVVAYQIAVGDTLYTVDENSNGETPQYLHVLRLSDLSVVGELQLDLPDGYSFIPGWCSGMVTDGSRLYLYGRLGVWIFDISNPLKPALLARPVELNYPVPSGAAAVVGGRHLLFLPGLESGLLSVYDASDTNQIKTLTFDIFDKNQSSQIIKIVWNGKSLVALIQQDDQKPVLTIFQLVNDEIKLQSTTPLDSAPNDMTAQNDLAALTGPGGLAIYSVADAAHPVMLSQTSLPASGALVAFRGSQLITTISGPSTQLLAFDVRDPANPALLTTADIPLTDALSTSDVYTVLTGTLSGIEVLK